MNDYFTGKVVWVEVDCPLCGNANRKARRACKHCRRTGKVMKAKPAERDDSMPKDAPHE